MPNLLGSRAKSRGRNLYLSRTTNDPSAKFGYADLLRNLYLSRTTNGPSAKFGYAEFAQKPDLGGAINGQNNCS